MDTIIYSEEEKQRALNFILKLGNSIVDTSIAFDIPKNKLRTWCKNVKEPKPKKESEVKKAKPKESKSKESKPKELKPKEPRPSKYAHLNFSLFETHTDAEFAKINNISPKNHSSK